MNTLIQELKREQLVPYYLMSSYLYYLTDKASPLTDKQFDHLCLRLIDEYERIKHVHKSLVSIESLNAGTGFNMKFDDYPKIVIGAAYNWHETHSIEFQLKIIENSS
jgi:hypothetical protein